MVQGDGMPRLALIFLHSVNAAGCFRWRDEDSTYSLSEPWAVSALMAIATVVLVWHFGI
jgi:hypothetical protein